MTKPRSKTKNTEIAVYLFAMGISVKDIAQRLGVKTSTIYLYFISDTGKQMWREIRQAMVREAAQEMIRSLNGNDRSVIKWTAQMWMQCRSDTVAPVVGLPQGNPALPDRPCEDCPFRYLADRLLAGDRQTADDQAGQPSSDDRCVSLVDAGPPPLDR